MSLEEERHPDDEVTDPTEEELYSSQDVGQIFRVDVKTVSRWAERGEFARRGVEVYHTIGGHRRFLKKDIIRLYDLMLEGKLYDEDQQPNRRKAKGVRGTGHAPAPDSGSAQPE